MRVLTLGKRFAIDSRWFDKNVSRIQEQYSTDVWRSVRRGVRQTCQVCPTFELPPWNHQNRSV